MAITTGSIIPFYDDKGKLIGVQDDIKKKSVLFSDSNQQEKIYYSKLLFTPNDLIKDFVETTTKKVTKSKSSSSSSSSSSTKTTTPKVENPVQVEKKVVSSVTAPAQLTNAPPIIDRNTIYQESFLTKVKKTNVGGSLYDAGKSVVTGGKNIYEIGKGTSKTIKEAEVTPKTAFYGLIDSNLFVGLTEPPKDSLSNFYSSQQTITTEPRVKKVKDTFYPELPNTHFYEHKTKQLNVIHDNKTINLGNIAVPTLKTKFSEERLSSSVTGANILISQDEERLNQEIKNKSNDLVRKEQDRLDSDLKKVVSNFEKKWENKINNNLFIGTEKEYKKYQSESKQLEQVINVEERKAASRYESAFNTYLTNSIKDFEDKSGKKISKARIRESVGKAPIYFSIGAGASAVMPGIVSAAPFMGPVLKTAGAVGSASLASSMYSKGLKGDYTSVAEMSIATGASIAGGLTYTYGKKAVTTIGDMVYTKKHNLARIKTPKLTDEPFVRRTAGGKEQEVFYERVQKVEILKPSTWKYKGLKPGTFYERTYRIIDPKVEGYLKGMEKVDYYTIKNGKVVLLQDVKTTPFPYDKTSKHLSWFTGQQQGVEQYYLPRKFLPANINKNIKGFGISSTPNEWVVDPTLSQYQVYYSGKGASAGFLGLGDKYSPDIAKSFIDPKRPTIYAGFFEDIKVLPGKETIIQNPIDPLGKVWKQYTFPKQIQENVLYLPLNKPEVEGVVAGSRLEFGKDLWFSFGGRRVPIDYGAYLSPKTLSNIGFGSSSAQLSSVPKYSYLPFSPPKISFLTSTIIPSVSKFSSPSFRYSSKPFSSYSSSFKPSFSYSYSTPKYSTPKYSISSKQSSYYSFKPSYSQKSPKNSFSFSNHFDFPTIKSPPSTPKDNYYYKVKTKVFKEKPLNKKYQASVGAIALDYGVSKTQFKNYKGKPFTGTELRPFIY